ncbi:hypothetical protein BJ138DRAFT_1020747 [Hygrophoropsis aurantiaca]|uniref:Uncharacterized protein n=1 Tax=Hygrophoropsis aurantiaca TaxID=72124 RepID=A0ACB7ZRB7_9AGAM|nr:hypothetical protein BJ138DRAFT_1020747 [Hygrophoropsis aurantiaca]
MPIVQTSPVRIVSQLIRRITEPVPEPEGSQVDEDSPAPFTTTQTVQRPPSTPIRPRGNLSETPVRTTISHLASTSAAFLFTSPPISSTSRIPAYSNQIISPLQYRRDQNLLNRLPATEAEHEMQEALRESKRREEIAKREMIVMQAAAVLQIRYCDRVRSQLATQEKKKTKQKSGRLVGDGLPRLLTGDVFVEKVIAHENAVEEEAKQKEVRARKRAEHSAVISEWKAAEKARIERNKAIKVIYKTEMAQWEVERDLAKVEKRRTRWNRPKMGVKEKPVPKPEVAPDGEDEDEEDDEEGEGDDDELMEQ